MTARPAPLSPTTPSLPTNFLLKFLRKHTWSCYFATLYFTGVGLELFRMRVEARGQTYYDYVERNESRKIWNSLDFEEKSALLVKHGKEYLIETLEKDPDD